VLFPNGGGTLEGKIEIPSQLWARLAAAAKGRGFESPERFVLHLIERELGKDQSSSSDTEIAQKMEELGYLDFGRDI